MSDAKTDVRAKRPGEGDTGDFFVVIALMVVILIGMLTYFRKRDWL